MPPPHPNPLSTPTHPHTSPAKNSYIESIVFTALVTTPLSLFLRSAGQQLLAAALESDLHVLRSYLRDVRQARAAAIGDAAHLALIAQSPHDDGSLALTGSVVSPLNAGAAAAGARAGAAAGAVPYPGAYIRRQRLQEEGGDSDAASPMPGGEASPRLDNTAASAPPPSPHVEQQQQQRWSVGRGSGTPGTATSSGVAATGI